MSVYTRRGDDGTTGLLHGGRVRKDAGVTVACGEVDEAQAVLGLARAEARAGGHDELEALLLGLQRDLWVLMAELATDPAHRIRLVAGRSLVTPGMVEALEAAVDDLATRFDPPSEFVVPGQDRLSALLDLARTVVRRAERAAVAVAVETDRDGSHVVPYLNRLSDLLWTAARAYEGEALPARRPTG